MHGVDGLDSCASHQAVARFFSALRFDDRDRRIAEGAVKPPGSGLPLHGQRTGVSLELRYLEVADSNLAGTSVSLGVE